MKYKHIFWDWNGTLIDDAYAACKAVNSMLSARDLQQITFEQYRDMIDVPIIEFYKKVMEITPEDIPDVSKEFHHFLEENIAEFPLFEGALSVLRFFQAEGIKQYIFTSSENRFIQPYLKKYSLESVFDSVIGANDCYVGSKTERTARFLREKKIAPEEVLFIGDMAHDSEVADLIAADCILVAAGHQSKTALLNTGRTVVDSVNDIVSVLDFDKEQHI